MIKHWIRHYMLAYDLCASRLTLALKASFIGLVGFFITSHYSIPQPLFLFLSAILFMAIAPPDSIKKCFMSMLFTGLATALGCFILTTVSNSILLTGLFFLVAFIITLLSYNKYIYINSSAVALLIIAFAAGINGDFPIAIERVINILIGLVIALLFTFVIYSPFSFRNRTNTAVYALNKIAEFFYHAMADSLRGNHLQVQHYKTKNQLIELFIVGGKVNFFIYRRNKRAAAKLIALKKRQQVLLNAIIATTNAFNNPLYYSSMSIFALAIEKFTEANYQFYKKAAIYIQDKSTELIEFPLAQTATDELIQQLQLRLASIAQSVTPYQGPDLTNTIYLLFILKEQNAALLKVLNA